MWQGRGWSRDGGEELMATSGEGRCPGKYGIHIEHTIGLVATMLLLAESSQEGGFSKVVR